MSEWLMMLQFTVLAAALAVSLPMRAEAQRTHHGTSMARQVEIAVNGGFTGPGPAVRLWTDARGIAHGKVTRRRRARSATVSRPLSWATALARLDSLGVWAPPPARPTGVPHSDTLPNGRVLSYTGVVVCTDGWSARVTLDTGRAQQTYALDPCGQPAAETARQEAIVRVVYDLAAGAR